MYQSKILMVLAQETGLDLGVNVFIFRKTQVTGHSVRTSAWN